MWHLHTKNCEVSSVITLRFCACVSVLACVAGLIDAVVHWNDEELRWIAINIAFLSMVVGILAWRAK